MPAPGVQSTAAGWNCSSATGVLSTYDGVFPTVGTSLGVSLTGVETLVSSVAEPGAISVGSSKTPVSTAVSGSVGTTAAVGVAAVGSMMRASSGDTAIADGPGLKPAMSRNIIVTKTSDVRMRCMKNSFEGQWYHVQMPNPSESAHAVEVPVEWSPSE